MRQTARIALFLFLALGPAAAQTQETPAISVAQMTRDTRLQADGRSVSNVHMELRVANDAAARQVGQQVLPFSAELETVDVVEAYTRKPDGQRIAVAPSAIYEQQAEGTQQFVIYADQRLKVIVFPQVGAGDTLVYTVRIQTKQPIIPGQYWYGDSFEPAVHYSDVRESVTAPKAMALYVESHDVEYSKEETATETTHRWHYVSAPGTPPAKATSFTLADVPRFYVTSFKDYAALGAGYAALTDPKAAVTPRVTQTANDIVAGVSDRRRQAQLLYDWVSRRIRYVGIELGAGSMVPHDADSILANGYGDCKDHVVLLTALLKARGIESQTVLINGESLYALPQVATFAPFNHVINWLPEFRLYADSTAAVAAFGTLPLGEYGKPVVHAIADGGVRHDVPLLAPGTAETRFITNSTMGADGALAGTSSITATGAFAADLRQSGLQIQLAGSARTAGAILQGFGFTGGTGDFETGDPTALSPDYAIKSRFTVPGWEEHTADGDGFYLPGVMRLTGFAGAGLLGPFNPGDGPLGDGNCFSGRAVEDLSLQAPPGRHFRSVPRNTDIRTASLQFTARWTLNGDTMSVHREFTSHVERPYCDAALRRSNADALKQIGDSFDVTVALSAVDKVELYSKALAATPGDAQTLVNRGRAFLQREDYDLAIADFVRAAAQKPDADTYLALTDAYWRKSDAARALWAVTSAVRLAPDSEKMLLARSLISRASGDTRQALADANAAIAHDPRSPRAYFSRASAYAAQQDYRNAAADYTQMLALEPENYDALLQLASADGELKDYDAEIASSEKAVKLTPARAAAYVGRAQGYLGKGDQSRAMASYDEALQRDATFIPALAGRAALHLARHEEDEAIADYTMVQAASRNSNFSLALRAAAYASLGKYDSAIADMTNAITHNGGSENYLLQRAQAYRLKGDLEAAAKDWERAATINSPSVAKTYRAIAARNRNDDAKAAASFAEAVKVDDDALASQPGTARLLNDRCWVRAIYGQELDRALEDCNRAIALQDTVNARNSRGLVNFRLGRYAQALADYDAAVAKRGAPNADTRYMRGLTQLRLKRQADADTDIGRARDINPSISAVYAFFGVTP